MPLNCGFFIFGDINMPEVQQVQSEYTKTRDVGVFVSKDPSLKFIAQATAKLSLECTVTDYSMTAPEGEEIDVSTLSSITKETISGLPAEATVSMNANFVIGNSAQQVLRKSYDTGDNYAFQIKYEDGSSIDWIARVTSYEFKGAKNGVVTGSFSFKVKGKFVFNAPSVNQGQK
jgi:predicted secreted protein